MLSLANTATEASNTVPSSLVHPAVVAAQVTVVEQIRLAPTVESAVAGPGVGGRRQSGMSSTDGIDRADANWHLGARPVGGNSRCGPRSTGRGRGEPAVVALRWKRAGVTRPGHFLSTRAESLAPRDGVTGGGCGGFQGAAESSQWVHADLNYGPHQCQECATTMKPPRKPSPRDTSEPGRC